MQIRYIVAFIIATLLLGCAPRKTLDSVYSVDITSSRKNYSEEERKLYEALIKGAPTPVRLPETIVRVLVLPHTDKDGILHSYKYMFIKLEDGKWIFTSKELKEQDDKVFKPLTLQGAK